MNHQPQRPDFGELCCTHIGGDAARTRQTIRLLGVLHTPAAVRAYRYRAVLHRIFELASAMPWAGELRNMARDAAQDAGADGESLRRSLEHVMLLADHRRARKIFDLARDELGATYSPAFGPARM
jgi:hypothetical protein